MQDIKKIQKILDFVVEIEKLKDVHRKTMPVGLVRYENSAEHSWHACISALMLKDYANDEINIDRVIKMLLIHDLGEIDAGDTIIYESETPENKKKEEDGLRRVLNLLPADKVDQYLCLWQEFEAGQTLDSKFAKAIDRVPPILHNLKTDCKFWKEHNIKKEQVFSINTRIAEGSKKLWAVLKDKINQAVSKGLLK